MGINVGHSNMFDTLNTECNKSVDVIDKSVGRSTLLFDTVITTLYTMAALS